MIEIQDLRKMYNGSRGLAGFTLRVEQGELFGLVGPNGAGKSTLMKILATLLPADGGSASIANHDLQREPEAVKRALGYLPDSPGVYQEMRIREFLEFFAAAYRLSGAEKTRAVELALQRSHLSDRADDMVEQLSLGWKQRLLLEKTLLHSPQVLLLDEPATGLDPIARIELREHLRQLNAGGVTILVTSHILTDLEDICSKVALIREGKNATDADGNFILELRRAPSALRSYEVEFVGSTDATAALASLGIVALSSEPGKILIPIENGDEEAARVLRELIAAGVQVTRFDHRTVGLEQRYKDAFTRRTV